jgi:hypothetical protein
MTAVRVAELPDGGRTWRLDFPVDVRALIIQGDEAARRSVVDVTLEPIMLWGRERRRSPEGIFARQAVQYERATVYFFDEGAFPEGDAFWIRGGRSAETAIVPAATGPSANLFIRNAPVANRFIIESGKWRRDLALAPGQELSVAIPLENNEQRTTSVRFQASDGFRPTLFDSSSRDNRFLGVWVQPR